LNLRHNTSLYARRYLHLYIKPCGWLVFHPKSLIKGFRILSRSLKHKRYINTLPRSGTHYLIGTLTSAIDIKNGGSGEFRFVNDTWVHNIDLLWPSVLHSIIVHLKNNQEVHKDFFMFGHHPISKTNIHKISSMKPVFTVRNIFDQLESWFLHEFTDYSAQDEFIRRGHVEKTIGYFNYWGDFISDAKKKPNKDYVCIRYEDLIANPLFEMSRILQLWNLEIDKPVLEKAIQLNSREKMKSKIPDGMLSDNKRLSIRDNRGKLFSEDNVSYINLAISNNLKHDFGYKY